jgi:hypothetical protein
MHGSDRKSRGHKILSRSRFSSLSALPFLPPSCCEACIRESATRVAASRAWHTDGGVLGCTWAPALFLHAFPKSDACDIGVLDAAKAETLLCGRSTQAISILGRRRDAKHGGADEDTLKSGTRVNAHTNLVNRVLHNKVDSSPSYPARRSAYTSACRAFEPLTRSMTLRQKLRAC